MKITEVTVYKKDNENSRIKGIASVVLDGCFKIKGIRIKDKEDRMILEMPSRIKPNGEREDVAHPLNEETRKMFEDAIFEEYNKL